MHENKYTKLNSGKQIYKLKYLNAFLVVLNFISDWGVQGKSETSHSAYVRDKLSTLVRCFTNLVLQSTQSMITIRHAKTTNTDN